MSLVEHRWDTDAARRRGWRRDRGGCRGARAWPGPETASVGRRRTQTARPGRRRTQTARPGRRRTQTARPGRRRIQTARPGRRRIQTARPGPGRTQTARPGPGRTRTAPSGRGCSRARASRGLRSLPGRLAEAARWAGSRPQSKVRPYLRSVSPDSGTAAAIEADSANRLASGKANRSRSVTASCSASDSASWTLMGSGLVNRLDSGSGSGCTCCHCRAPRRSPHRRAGPPRRRSP